MGVPSSLSKKTMQELISTNDVLGRFNSITKPLAHCNAHDLFPPPDSDLPERTEEGGEQLGADLVMLDVRRG